MASEQIRIRDPFILAEQETGTYYMYASSANRKGSGYLGVEAYESKDLKKWNLAGTVMEIPEGSDVFMVWAPEVHAYRGKYYLFVTLTHRKELPIEQPAIDRDWPLMHIRGTYVYVADKPRGPFQKLKDGSHTPPDWMALDGTLHVEDQAPYMVFCHEWVQTIDGTMDVVKLSDDLSDVEGAPQLLFQASDAPGAHQGDDVGKVTDGCFLYRSRVSGKLFMIWSTLIPGNGYCVFLTESESGSVVGPWTKHIPVYRRNGGHGMLFESLDGRLLMALHQPNTRGKERLHLFELEDTGDSLVVKSELFP
jgi:Glycosyl hydrolases family 43